MDTHPTHVLFRGNRLIARGSLTEIAAAAWDVRNGADVGDALIAVDRETGGRADLTLGDGRDAAIARASALDDPPPVMRRGRGRPRLGVIGREVTLLPAQWRWLEGQTGSASAVLRRLVHEAMKGNVPSIGTGTDGIQAADRFLAMFAGDLPGYEEATRWLYRRDRERFAARMEGWPEDVRDFALELAKPGLES